MDIAALSMGLSTVQLQQQVSVSVLRKVMDTQTASAQTLIQDMAPQSGHRLDVTA